MWRRPEDPLRARAGGAADNALIIPIESRSMTIETAQAATAAVPPCDFFNEAKGWLQAVAAEGGAK